MFTFKEDMSGELPQFKGRKKSTQKGRKSWSSEPSVGINSEPDSPRVLVRAATQGENALMDDDMTVERGRPRRNSDANIGLMQKKIVYLVRHAQALHNVQEQRAREETKAKGGSVEEQEAARKDVLKDPSFKDAPLSRSGEQQVEKAAGSFAELTGQTHSPAPEVMRFTIPTLSLASARAIDSSC